MARVAFLLGIRDYGIGLESLPASPRDVDAVSAVLQKQEFGHFHHVTALKDDPQTPSVSRGAAEEALEQWCRNHESDDVALLYVSGRLIWDAPDEVFLATNETRYDHGSLVRSSALSGSFVRQCLHRSVAKAQIVILDCCFCQSDGVGSMLCHDLVDIARHFGGDRRVILVSSDDWQYSAGQKQDRLSIYTQFLVEGIVTGLADGDRDQQVSIQELHAYAQEKLQIATPAITPKLVTSSNDLSGLRISKVHIPDAHRQFHNEVNRFIQRHGHDESPISARSLVALQQQLGISDDCAQVLRQTVLSPYQSLQASLDKYREVVTRLIQCGTLSSPDTYCQLDTARYRLGLTQPLVDPINQELWYLRQLRGLEQYRDALSHALKREKPLSDVTCQDLADLRVSLGISEQDERLISQEVDAYWKTHQQKLKQYEVKFQQAIQNGVVQNSLIREELDNFRQSLGLSNQDIEPLEKQVQQAMIEPSDSPNTPNIKANNDGDRLRRLQTFKRAFAEAANRHLPITSADQHVLNTLQQELGLSNEWVQSIKADTIQVIKAREAMYQEKLASYEEAYREAASRGLPLSDAALGLMHSLEKSLQIKGQDVQLIEEQIYAQWQLKREAEMSESQPSEESVPDSGGSHLPQEIPLTELEQALAANQRIQPSFDTTSANPGHLNGMDLDADHTDAVAVDHLNADRADRVDASHSESSSMNMNGAPGMWLDRQNMPDQQTHLHSMPNNVMDSDDQLLTNHDIDYRTLQEFTRNHRWDEADSETFAILLKLAEFGRRKVEWLDHQAIADLSCIDLHTIDRLWRRYSYGRFGFSAQCRIYFGMTDSTQSVNDYSTTFGQRVGWMLWGKEFTGFKYYDQLSFDHLNALEGHLPAKWFWKIPWWESVRCGGLGTGRGGCGDDGGVLFTFMKKLLNCNINEND